MVASIGYHVCACMSALIGQYGPAHHPVTVVKAPRHWVVRALHHWVVQAPHHWVVLTAMPTEVHLTLVYKDVYFAPCRDLSGMDGLTLSEKWFFFSTKSSRLT